MPRRESETPDGVRSRVSRGLNQCNTTSSQHVRSRGRTGRGTSRWSHTSASSGWSPTTNRDLMRSARGLDLSGQTSKAWESAGRHVRSTPAFGSRDRAGRLAAAGAAAVYLRYFAPPVTWALSGVEVMLGDGRVDLEWTTNYGTVVYDELKLASTPGRHRGNGPARRQAMVYVAHGTEIHGPSLRGRSTPPPGCAPALDAHGAGRSPPPPGENALLVRA